MRVYSSCGQALTRATNEIELLYEICRRIVADGGYKQAWVGFAGQDEQKTVRPAGQYGFEAGYLDTLNVVWSDTEHGRGPTGTAIRTGQPSVANHIQSDPRFEPRRAAAIEQGYAAALALPLISGGQTLGVLIIHASEPDAFDAEEVALLGEVADDLAFGVLALHALGEESEQQARALAAERRRREQLELLEQVSSSLRQAENMDELFSGVVEEVRALVHMDVEAILLLRGEQLEYAIVRGPQELKDWLHKDIISKDELVKIVKSGQAEFRSDLPFDVQGSAAVLPLTSGQGVHGALILYWFEQKEFSVDEQRLLATIVDMAGIALERMQVFETLEQQVADRTFELSTLYAVTTLLASDEDFSSMLSESLEKLLTAIDAEAGALHLLDEEHTKLELFAQHGLDVVLASDLDTVALDSELWGRVIIQEQAMLQTGLQENGRVPAVIRDTDLQGFVGVPIRPSDTTLGVLGVFYAQGREPSSEQVGLINLVAEQIGLAFDRAQLRQKAELAAITEERQRLARELHDAVIQSLYSLLFLAKAAGNFAASGKWGQARHNLVAVQESAQKVLKEMRLLVYELLPASLQERGLVGILQHRLRAVEQRSGMETHFGAEGNIELPSALQLGIYRIAQEALNNVLKHASASEVSLHLSRDGQRVEMEIEDNGNGFNVNDSSAGMGLQSMRERAEALGGVLRITSKIGAGTSVQLVIEELAA